MKGLLQLTRMRFLLTIRQPEVMFWSFVFPIMLSLVLGFAFGNAGPGPSIVAVVGDDVDLTMLEESPDLTLVSNVDETNAPEMLLSGAIDVWIRLQPSPELHFDEQRMASVLGHKRVLATLSPPETLLVAVPSEESGDRFIDWFFPGLLALSIMSTSVWAVGFSFVEARQKKLIKRFLVTPMGRPAFLLAPILSRMAVLVLEVVVLLVFARLVFDIPFRGSLVTYSLLCVTGALVFAGIGVLLGSRSGTPESAAGLINLAMMPMGLTSGIFFSYERFSEPVQVVIRNLPLAPFVDSLRGVMLHGNSFGTVLPAMGIQLAWGTAAFVAGLALFRWK